MRRLSSDRWLGALAVVAALALILLWVPLDTETGVLERVRRRLVIGDALAPLVAGVTILIGGLLTALRPDDRAVGLTARNLRWMLGLCAVFTVSLAVMRFAGPALAEMLSGTGYRPLRNDAPWKFIGYVLGGAVMVAGTGGLAMRRRSPGLLVMGLMAAALIALAYDLLPADLLLPPNGDV